jgi:small ligand-binding sensory domain FIST
VAEKLGGAEARCGDGLGEDADLLVAAEQAAGQALTALGGDAPPDLAAVFACGSDPDETGAALTRAAELTGARTVLGCNAPGVLGAGRAVELGSAVSVLVASLPGTSLRSFHLEVLRTSESIAVVGLPPRRPDDERMVLLADPWSFPADSFVEQAPETLPGQTITGGLAAGLRGAGSTRLMVDGQVHDRGAVGVVLGGGQGSPGSPGSPRSTAVVSQGARPVGPLMTVTAADGDTLLELAGVPAATRLETLVADLPPEEQALVTAGVLLGITVDEYADEHSTGDFLVRGIVGVDTERAGLVVGDLVPVGRTVQLHVRDAATADAELRSVLAAAYGAGRPVPAGALLVACTGRGSGLFPAADHDVAVVREVLGEARVAGFFAAGEFGPVAGRTHLHTLTASLLAFDR